LEARLAEDSQKYQQPIGDIRGQMTHAATSASTSESAPHISDSTEYDRQFDTLDEPVWHTLV
jgi:hypothetical protein